MNNDKQTSSCLKLIEFCRADCCRQGGVMLTPDEAVSGKYETEIFCLKKKELCNKEVDCYYKITQIKTVDGTCIYLKDDRKCGIYENRPEICRKFNCRGGREFFGPELEWHYEMAHLSERDLIRFTGKLVFTRNPFVHLKAIIPEYDTKNLFLLVRDMEMCEDTMFAGELPWPEANEETIKRIYESFDGKKTLGEIEDILSKESKEISLEEIEKRVRSLLVMFERRRLLVPIHFCG